MPRHPSARAGEPRVTSLVCDAARLCTSEPTGATGAPSGEAPKKSDPTEIP